MQLRINPKISRRIQLAIKEDLNDKGDLTSQWTLPADHKTSAQVVSHAAGVIAGGQAFLKVFHYLDRQVEVSLLVSDGERVKQGQVVATLSGPTRSILAGERTALNFLCWLSGIATLTRRFVDIAEPLKVQILDTRKTTPLWRSLEKYAVLCGGGRNHRFGLFDRVLVKDNHLQAVGNIRRAIRKAKEARDDTDIQIEVEVENVEQAREAAQEGVDIIMLDNMTPAEVRDAAVAIAGAAEIEVSGGVTLDNVHDYAETGVDYISIGSLTHSPTILNMSLGLVE